MFEELTGYKYVLVTGPQRSGTTIVAHMIGYDTGKVVLDEVNFHHRYVRQIPELLAKERSCVLQCPQALPWMPVLTRDDMMIVLVRRDVEEIERSLQKSVSPKGKKVSLPWFSPQQAYDLWDRIRPLLLHSYEVSYGSIVEHYLYISPGKRKRGWTHKSIDANKHRYDRFDYGKGFN